MMLQLARRGRLSSVASKLRDFPAPPSMFAAAISSAAASKPPKNWSSEPIHAQISQSSTKELKAQLADRNLDANGKKPRIVGRMARPLSTSSSQQRATAIVKPIEEVPEMPDIKELTKEDEAPIRVPLTPDNKFARYHRHEIVPEVAPPLKHEVTTVLPDASKVIDQAADTLADILESISVEVKAHKSQSQYNKEHSEVKDSVKDIIKGITSGMYSMMPKEGSALHVAVKFPADLVKDMVEDAFLSGKQLVKEEKQGMEEKNQENEGPQVLTDKERTTIYTIAGLSVVWYLFGY